MGAVKRGAKKYLENKREVKVVLDGETYAMLDELSRRYTISQAAVVRLAIRAFYEQHQHKER